MKSRLITSLFLAPVAMTGLLMCACAKDAVVQPQPVAAVQAQPAAAVPPAVITVPVAPAPTPMAAPATASVLIVNPDASNTWSGMKDLTFDQRAAFLAGLNALEGTVDAEVSGLNAKRTAMTTDTKDWDFAMKGLVDDQAYLKGLNAEVSKAEAENWLQERDKVEAAWQNTQDAYAKVIHSTTAP
ncbi:MAG TPA: hypothetical protein VII43_09295 [Opitutaceae bacterium]